MATTWISRPLILASLVLTMATTVGCIPRADQTGSNATVAPDSRSNSNTSNPLDFTRGTNTTYPLQAVPAPAAPLPRQTSLELQIQARALQRQIEVKQLELKALDMALEQTRELQRARQQTPR